MIHTLRDFLRTRYERAPLVRDAFPVLEKPGQRAASSKSDKKAQDMEHFAPVLSRLEQVSQRF